MPITDKVQSQAGDASALEGCREELRATLGRALDTVRASGGERGLEVEEIYVTLDLYGAFETKVWAPAYHLGRALQSLLDHGRADRAGDRQLLVAGPAVGAVSVSAGGARHGSLPR